jgi:lipoprotein NlpD
MLALAGCATSPWDALFSDVPAARPLTLMAPPAVAAGYYRVNPGDTLATVAYAFGREPSQIANWNGLPEGYAVNVGEVLRVAPAAGAAPGTSSVATPGSPAPISVAAAPDNATVSAPAASTRSARFAWPASGPVTSAFVAGQSRSIHIGGTVGTTITAADIGRVIYAGSQIKAYGLLVIIKHDKRFITAYGNNAKLLVTEGETVKQGQPIAQMGAAEDPSPYLIFELRDGGKAVDPQSYLPKRAG